MRGGKFDFAFQGDDSKGEWKTAKRNALIRLIQIRDSRGHVGDNGCSFAPADSAGIWRGVPDHDIHGVFFGYRGFGPRHGGDSKQSA